MEKYKFQATKDHGSKFQHLTNNPPFIVSIKRLHILFNEIIVCMCREYQIIQTAIRTIKLENSGYSLSFFDLEVAYKSSIVVQIEIDFEDENDNYVGFPMRLVISKD